MVYALADRGARLLYELDGSPHRRDLTEKNNAALRPFIEHQLGIVDFHVAMHCASLARRDVTLLDPEELVHDFPQATQTDKNPLKLSGTTSADGRVREFGIVPDLILGLRFPDKSRRCFMIEIDRGTMPVTRSDPSVTSYSQKMQAYLAAHAAGGHERRYGWRAFRVLTVTTDRKRVRSMIDALGQLPMPPGPGASLFFFTTRDEIVAGDPLALQWRDGRGKPVTLL